jgi:hypothetical protein
MDSNTISYKKAIHQFSDPDLRFTISSRLIQQNFDIAVYLKVFYTYIKQAQIDSVFGSLWLSSELYGGRTFSVANSLTELHLTKLEHMGIGVSITFTNHYYTLEAYERSLDILERLHHKRNSVICVSDELASRIRSDFPAYSVRASIIKNLNTVEKIEKAFKCYDQVVIPMDKNDDDRFLRSLPEKYRIMLFANASCAYSCRIRTCYRSFSKRNIGENIEVNCSRTRQGNTNHGEVFFNVKKLKEMGFTNYKLIPQSNATLSKIVEEIMKTNTN